MEEIETHMRDLIVDHFEHFLCVLILLGRVGDIGSTYLVTPRLTLEANPIVRKFGWKFAWLTLLVCLVPYYSTAFGIVVLVPSLLVSAANISRIWFIRAYGETEYRDLIQTVARRSKLSHALVGVIGSALFIVLAGSVLIFLCLDPNNWGYWFGIGIVAYGIAIGLHHSVAFLRIFKSAKRQVQT